MDTLGACHTPPGKQSYFGMDQFEVATPMPEASFGVKMRDERMKLILMAKSWLQGQILFARPYMAVSINIDTAQGETMMKNAAELVGALFVQL
jgi:hypothetical protein